MGGVRPINRRKEGAGGRGQVACGGWEPGCQPRGLAHPQVISFFVFLAQSFPNKKRPEAPRPHPSEKSCLRLARGLLGDAVAAGAGTTPVPASPHRLQTPSPPALHMPENQCKWYTLSCPGQLSARPSFPFHPALRGTEGPLCCPSGALGELTWS